MKILGIETSCDETAAAVVEGRGGRLKVLSNVVASQARLHAKTGGVVPEVAARSHMEAIIPVIGQALREAGIKPFRQRRISAQGGCASGARLGWKTSKVKGRLDAIAVTVGPGLITSLRVGVETARALAAAWDVPVVAVNHLEGHVYSNWLPNPPNPPYLKGGVRFPVLALIVSGGHTELVLMRKHLDYKIIGQTRDDAAGEALDKVAKILGLGYPGGPAISRLAEKGDPQAIDFPRPMIDSLNFDFSFSGLKTAVLYYLRNIESQTSNLKPQTSNLKPDVCSSFEQAIVDVLVAKTIRAAKRYKAKTVLLGGGVAANKKLRQELGAAINHQLPTTSQRVSKVDPAHGRHFRARPGGNERSEVTFYLLPTLNYTTDNAAMIAAAGLFKAQKKKFMPWRLLKADPNLKIGN